MEGKQNQKKKNWKQTDKQDKSEEQDKRQTDCRLSKKEERRQTTSITWTNFAITKPPLSLSHIASPRFYWKVQKVCQSLRRFVYQVFVFVFFPLYLCILQVVNPFISSFAFIFTYVWFRYANDFCRAMRKVRYGGTSIKSWLQLFSL